MKVIDLRSDTVTQPTAAMRSAIAEAAVGDDVYGEDPTVNALESYAAELLGKAAAIYCPSGTQSNLLALLSHCERGDEYIVGQRAHTYLYEGGGGAVLGSIQPQPLDFERPGVIPIEKIEAAIKPDDSHFVRSRLVCLENTQNGCCLPAGYVSEVKAVCDRHQLAMHLDGARLFNASVKLGIPVAALAADFDTVSICLSKGLGAPMGSLLCGDENSIKKARRWRKVLGGGLRQAGMMAAAGRYALENHIQRLSQDHANAAYLAQQCSNINGLTVEPGSGETNMVFISLPETALKSLKSAAAERNIKLSPGKPMRLVTHMDVDQDDMEQVATLFRDVCTQ